MVLLETATDGVEEPVFEVAAELEVVLEVGALDAFRFEVGGDIEGAALVLITEAEEGRVVMAEGEVGLVVELVAVGVLVAVGGEELGLPGGGVAVGSADEDGVAEQARVAAAVGRCALRAEVGALLPLAGDAVADEVVPAAEGSVLEGSAGVEVLVGELAVLDQMVEVVRVGEAVGGVGVAEGEAEFRGGGEVEA